MTGNRTHEIRKGRNAAYGILLGAVLLAVLLVKCIGAIGGNGMDLFGKKMYTVGTDIQKDDITEFYWTRSSSTNPPDYQRYRFYAADGKYFFYHEKREGRHWPLTENDVTVSGTKELTADEWEQFFGFLKDGSVKKRSDSAESGGAGPWTYLYWKNDRSRYQEFSFASSAAGAAFEEFCRGLKD